MFTHIPRELDAALMQADTKARDAGGRPRLAAHTNHILGKHPGRIAETPTARGRLKPASEMTDAALELTIRRLDVTLAADDRVPS